jgi:RimJ/RimL family protein N-acetyltransferase
VRRLVDAVHAAGARVAAHTTTAHVKSLIGAGIDSVEHGTGLDEDDLAELAARGGAWTPTLCAFTAVASTANDRERRERCLRARDRLRRLLHELSTVTHMAGRELGNEEMLTPRLSLRRPIPADIDTIYSIHSDRKACAHNPADMLTVPTDAEDLYRRWDEHWQRHGFGYWVIRTRHGYEPGEPIGFCGVKLVRFQGREVLNLFYRLDPSAWGNGFAAESAVAVIGWATTHVPDHPVVARIRPDNAASLRVAARTRLHRAEHLDSIGEDGLDWIFTSSWPDRRTL